MRRSLLWLCLAALGFLASEGKAADTKRMAANACLLEYDYDNQYYDRGGARIGVTLGNAQPLNVDCPLIRSNTTNTNGLSGVTVRLFKQASTRFVCYAESYDANGSALKIVQRSTTNTGLVALDWGTSLNTSSAKGTYGLSCEITGAANGNPWGDEMYSIEYTEP